ncbi:hypothetical protein WCLP8_4150001 [uncultured Gammaproteobacteria bacterium]
MTDTGIGIAADQIEHVMQPFEQIDNRFSRAGGGTGLGLPLVKGLVEPVQSAKEPIQGEGRASPVEPKDNGAAPVAEAAPYRSALT